MPGLVPGIHVIGATSKEDVDGRDKPGHDEKPTHTQAVAGVGLPRKATAPLTIEPFRPIAAAP
jgi:hypothetical protein